MHTGSTALAIENSSLRKELEQSKADNQAIMEINNQLRHAMLELRNIIDANVK